ncbi:MULTISPECIES: replicative DNA helicase [Streptomyces]|uniref:DNA helicase n=1 Tax=Streptomyces fradiae ATCC 10745 = DSM 40063 TaxID=1319510 RepID=A0A1Y2NNN6_STRFR|nr:MULTISPECIES: DnaB-like helicase C-terminal domain-containing protein [Streptomyces]KAF0646277.1 DNA helicase [Streptomyces fradiae ATCC 10745 = DSM 40063]OSY49086.1 Replicative DNA helicase [Streptomyces fradiae ATCC 10745 = DSM 40063]
MTTDTPGDGTLSEDGPDASPTSPQPEAAPFFRVAGDTAAMADWLEEALDDIEAIGQRNFAVASAQPPRSEGWGRLDAIATGFEGLDAVGILHPGSLTIIASRPQVGRTTLMSDFCRAAAIKNNLPTAVFSLEEDQTRFFTRLLSAEARVARHHIHCGVMTDEDWTRLARRMPEVVGAPLILSVPARLTMAELSERCHKLAGEHGLRLIAIDGLQAIKPHRYSDLREREVGDVARGLKTLARELDIPVVVTSHLNRSAETRYNRVPMLDDLRESGAVTYEADTIILLHREDAYEKDSPRAGEADLIVAKNRQGPTFTETIAFQGHYGRFVRMMTT